MAATSRIGDLIAGQSRLVDWRSRYPPLCGDDRKARVMHQLSQCGRGVLGARYHQCSACHRGRVSLNACHERHCPACAKSSSAISAG